MADSNVLTLDQLGLNPVNQTSSQNTPETRPSAEIWLNVGYSVPVQNPKEGEDTERFISLPVGIPLDTMQPVTSRSQNADYNQLIAARNNLHEVLLKAASELQPGEAQNVNLTVQIRRVNSEPEVPSADQNQYIPQEFRL